MAERLLKDVYETPWALVRGVFLCNSVAAECSVLTGGIEQEAWGSGDTPIGGGVSDTEDIWLE